MNPKSRKTKSKRNDRCVKTYDPNHEPWLTMEEINSILIAKRMKQNSQNGSAKGENYE